MMTEPIVYRTKIGKLFWLSIVLTVALSVVIVIFSGISAYGALVIFFLTTVTVLLVIAAGYDIRYTFEKDRLEIDCRFTLKEPPIKYSEIRRVVSRSKGVYVVWGSSTDCIEIHYGRSNRICISPVNKEEFIRILKEQCPQAAFEVMGKG